MHFSGLFFFFARSPLWCMLTPTFIIVIFSSFTSPESQASSQFLTEMLNDEDIVSHVILGSIISILTIWDVG